MLLNSTERVDLYRTIAESDLATLTEADIDALIDLFDAWLERREQQG